MTDTLRAGPQTRITLHFAVRLMDGTEMDSTYGGEPAAFSWGDESLMPGFERVILGLKAGDKRSVFIDAASGFGEYNEQNRQHFKRSTFSADDVEVGTVMNFADAAGAELPGVIAELDDDWVTVDFNHPLAGRDLTFEVVNRALDVFGPPVYVRHEVVHNRYVVDGLRERGAVFVDELEEVPDDAIVIFSAHGVSKAVQDEAEQRALQVFEDRKSVV